MFKVYVAGPYTKGDVAQNVVKAIKAGNELAEKGFAVFIPHFTHFWHMLYEHPYEFWLAQDLEWVRVCDALLRIPGDSSGADREADFAIKNGILVFHSMEGLLSYYGKV